MEEQIRSYKHIHRIVVSRENQAIVDQRQDLDKIITNVIVGVKITEAYFKLVEGSLQVTIIRVYFNLDEVNFERILQDVVRRDAIEVIGIMGVIDVQHCPVEIVTV